MSVHALINLGGWKTIRADRFCLTYAVHVIQDVASKDTHSKDIQLEYLRSDNCPLLSEGEESCSKCQKLKVKVKSEVDWKKTSWCLQQS